MIQLVSICFFISGFCSLLYQMVWLHYTASSFGVNTPVISSFLSIFMIGLALGSFRGQWIKRQCRKIGISGFGTYAVLEAWIGLGGVAVPWLLGLGRDHILSIPMAHPEIYFSATFLILLIALLPFCLAMGATFPVALASLKEAAASQPEQKQEAGFSRLYLWNLRGAMLGVIVPVFLTVELLGFKNNLRIGIVFNAVLVMLALSLARRFKLSSLPETAEAPAATAPKISLPFEHAALFLFGFTSMGLEVLWTRVYTPFLFTLVYSFASILSVYFIASAAGTSRYRNSNGTKSFHWAWLAAGPAAMICLSATDTALPLPPFLRLLIGVAPASFIFGILTPSLIDRISQSSPEKMGPAYAANLLGCILGPLVTGFLLIPYWGNFGACFFLVCLLLGLSLLYCSRLTKRRGLAFAGTAAACAVCLLIPVLNKPYESHFKNAAVFHDHTATVIAAGEGMEKQLLVNGVGMTKLTTITKMMVHLPLSHLSVPPKKGLIICFGMGTSFRSMNSWDIPTTAVELVPAVIKTFPYFYPEAEEFLKAKKDSARIVVDDGRRFLDRTREKYDVIVIDPPPPVEASSSGLLYSKEFYQSVNNRLSEDGILQAWLPGGDAVTVSAVTQALLESFPYVRMFRSCEGWGVHYLASRKPISVLTADALLQKMPDAAILDLAEWIEPASEEPRERARKMLLDSMTREINPQEYLAELHQFHTSHKAPLTDDWPVNEYFLLRRFALKK